MKIVLSLLLGMLLSSCVAGNSNTNWIYLKATKGYAVFINKNIVKKDDTAKSVLRYSWPKAKIKKAKNNFERANMLTKKKFGHIPKNTEKLFEAMIKSHTRYYAVKANCKKNKIYIYQGIVTITSIAKGDSDAEKIEKILCKR